MAHSSDRTRFVLGGVGLAYGLSGVVFGVGGAQDQLGRSGPGLLVACGLATGVCYLLVLLNRWPGWSPALLALVAVGGAAMQVISPYTGLGFAFTLAWLAAFSVPLRLVVVIGLLDAAGVLVASLARAPLYETQSSTFGETVGITFGILFSFALAVAVQQLSVVRERTEAAAQAHAREAVLAERQRLAREVHDVLAHSLSAQILHLEGARLLLERGDAPEQALDQVRRAGRLARAGLVETKQALSSLRGDDLRVIEQLEALAREFRSATGATCEVTVSGDPGRLAPEARLAVVRTAQEALTNVRKHAPGASATVQFSCDDDWCELEVHDVGGPPGELAATGSGYGLVGMRDRAELIGGTVAAGREVDGFRVVLRVPLPDADVVAGGSRASTADMT